MFRVNDPYAMNLLASSGSDGAQGRGLGILKIAECLLKHFTVLDKLWKLQKPFIIIHQKTKFCTD